MTTEERLLDLEIQVRQALELVRHHAREHIDEGDDPIEQQVVQGHGHDEIRDEDNDTKWQAEESADEDILRADTGGTERATISSAGLAVDNVNELVSAAGVTIEGVLLKDNEVTLTNERIQVINATSGSAHFEVFQSGDTFPRLRIRSESGAVGASLSFGPGGGSDVDVTLQRSAADVLRTPDSFTVDKTLEAALLNLTDETTLTISSGQIARTQTLHLVDTEGAAATDILRGMSGGAEGDVVALRAAAAARDIAVEHENTAESTPAGDRFHIHGDQSLVLDPDEPAIFIYLSSRWRSWNQGRKHSLAKTAAPGTGDDSLDGYSVGSVWIDTSADKAYICLDATSTAAVWIEITQSGGGGSNHTFDSSTHTDVGAMTEAQGDLIRWSGSAWENVAAVTAGAVVGGDGTDVVATVPERTILLLAQGGTPATTSGCATAVVVEAATNDVDYWVLDFATGADEFAFWGPIVLPDNYDGGDFKATFYWTAASGSGTVAWAIQMQALANDDAIDTAWPTADVASADTLIAAGDVHITTELTGITPANTPADGDLMFIRVFRDVSADNLGVDARLIAVKLHYTLNAISDN